MDPAEQSPADAVAFRDDDNAFAIVARLRHARRGKPIAFRGGDLGALSTALGFDPERVEERIAGCWDAHLASGVRKPNQANEPQSPALSPFTKGQPNARHLRASP